MAVNRIAVPTAQRAAPSQNLRSSFFSVIDFSFVAIAVYIFDKDTVIKHFRRGHYSLALLRRKFSLLLKSSIVRRLMTAWRLRGSFS